MLIFIGMPINACNITGSAQLCGNRLPVYILGLGVPLLLISGPKFIAFLELEIQSAIDRLLPASPTKVKRMETNKFVRGFC